MKIDKQIRQWAMLCESEENDEQYPYALKTEDMKVILTAMANDYMEQLRKTGSISDHCLIYDGEDEEYELAFHNGIFGCKDHLQRKPNYFASWILDIFIRGGEISTNTLKDSEGRILVKVASGEHKGEEIPILLYNRCLYLATEKSYDFIRREDSSSADRAREEYDSYQRMYGNDED